MREVNYYIKPMQKVNCLTVYTEFLPLFAGLKIKSEKRES